MNYKLLLLLIVFSCSFHSYGKQIEPLKQQINSLLKGKNATVGVAILAGDDSEHLSINGNTKLPMQSVFKYHLALAVLDQIDKKNLSLSDRVSISPKDLDNNLWSPIRKKYPDGTNLSLAEVLKYTVAHSDNVGCDILFNIVGGTKVVEAYLHKQGIMDVAIEYDEITQQLVWDRMYDNWTTANAAIAVLKLFYENKENLLSQDSHQFLWDTMKSSGTGKDKIKGLLPEGTIVAHKTGSSGRNKLGLTGAENDIGIVFLPDGRHFYIGILVSNSTETREVNKKIIADISKIAWDYFKN
jgi:beta-lactamase class A/beta-lactamase class A VEB